MAVQSEGVAISSTWVRAIYSDLIPVQNAAGSLASDNHMIDETNTDDPERRLHFPRERSIVLRRFRTPARMIVCKDNGSRPFLQSSARDFPGKRRGAVDGATGEEGGLDDAVAGVEEEGDDDFLGFAGEAGAAVVGDEAGVGEGVGAGGAVAEGGDGGGAGGEEGVGDGGAGAGDGEDVGARGVEEAAEAAAEGLEEGAGEGLDVAAADGEAEEEFEDLVVGEGVEAGALEAGAEAPAVAGAGVALSLREGLRLIEGGLHATHSLRTGR